MLGKLVKMQIVTVQTWDRAQDTVFLTPSCCWCCWLGGHTLKSKGREVQLDWDRQNTAECDAHCEITPSLGNMYFK